MGKTADLTAVQKAIIDTLNCASKEEQEEEDPQKKEETAPYSSRSTSAWSEILPNDDDDKRDGGSSVKSFDQAKYDLGRLLASHSMCTRMFQGRIHHFSEQLIGRIYQILLDTRMGQLPSTPHCRSEPNFQNLEDKERRDQEFFTPLLYNFFQTAFKGLMGNLLGEEDFTDDHRASCSDASSDGSDSNSDSSSDSSDCPSLDWSRGMTPGPRQGVEGRRRSQSRLKPSCSQDQRWALEAICEVLTTQAESDLYKTCNNPRENMVVFIKGLDAEAMTRVGNLAGSSSEEINQEVATEGLEPESSLTNQQVGQLEMDDNENAAYPDDFHEKDEGSDCQMNDFSKGALIEEEEKDEDDGAAGLPEEVQNHPSLPVSPSETPSLQPEEALIRHAEVWRPSAVSGESHDLETGCEEKESTEDSAGLEKAGGSSSPFISNTSLDEGLEMDTAGLEKAGRNSTTFVTNTSLDEGLEMDSAALEKASGSSSPFISNTSLDEGLEMDSAALEKASGSSSPFISNTSLDEGLEMDSAALEKVSGSSSPFISNTSLDEGLEMDSAALEKASGSSSPFISNTSLDERLETECAGLEKASRLASCLSSSSTSWSCYSSSSSTSVLSSPSSSKSSISSSTSRGSTAQAPSPEGHHLGKTDTPILRKWFTLKKEKTFLKDGRNVAAKGRKTSIIFRTNKVSPLSAERPDLGESSIAGGEEKKKKKKSFKAFFRGISAVLSRAFCFSCVNDIHQ
ncbi:dentin sialophosphoprotein-like [Hypomesus transpacificus]|uniref:dentin sialophosphoprotein-like n=1 Tax=Hypomesus transpacificus TaxID=137520 RepID=UPI001F07170B|nr:dentin sialophosphoprotein-like [Hypomesus transpacificus]